MPGNEDEHYVLPTGRYVRGRLNEVVDEALHKSGLDLDLLAEYFPILDDTDMTEPVGIA